MTESNEQIIRRVRDLIDAENTTFQRLAEIIDIPWEEIQSIYNGFSEDIDSEQMDKLRQKIFLA